MNRNTVLKIVAFTAAVALTSTYWMSGSVAEPITDIPPIMDAEGNAVPDGLASIERVPLGGFEQSILIRTQDVSNPVHLILHGGAGATLMPFIDQIQPAALEENFMVVHWDQRSAGNSYVPALTIEDLSAGILINDTLEVTNLLRDRFAQGKIFLTGHSWGSGLDFLIIQQDSSAYLTYIASAERVSWESSRQAGFDWIKQQATEQQVAPVLEQIAAIEPFITYSYDLSPSYLRSDIPVHFIQGEHDQYALKALSRPYSEALDTPTKSHTVISGADHSMMYDNPKDWADALNTIKNFTLNP